MKNILNLFLLIALAACTAKADEPKKEKPQLLFIVHATKGHYANGTLTLMQASPGVSYFSDRPARKGGVMSLENFLDGWSTSVANNFTQNPPNAGIVFFEDTNEKYSEIPVELQAPKYNKAQNVLTFEVRFITDKKLPDNKQLQEVDLFIDAGSR